MNTINKDELAQTLFAALVAGDDVPKELLVEIEKSRAEASEMAAAIGQELDVEYRRELDFSTVEFFIENYKAELSLESNQQTVGLASINSGTASNQDEKSPTETPKKFISKAIGAPIYKVEDLPPELTAFIKDRFGSRTMIATPKENGSYKGEVLDTQTHLIQSVSARSVVVHRKDEMTFKGSVEQANKSDKLSGWELGIYYDGNKPAVYPHDSQRESFEFAAKQLRKQTPDAEKPAFDERAKAAWSNVVQMRKQRAAMQKAASTPEKAPEKAPEASKPEVKETKPSKQKR